MGLIRGGLAFFVGFLLLLLFLIGGILLTFSLSLEHDALKPQTNSIFNNLLYQQPDFKESINREIPAMVTYCKNKTEYSFTDTGLNLTIPCSKVSEGSSSIINNSFDNLFEQFYYKDYSCDFWSCFKDGELPFYLISAKSKDYWTTKFYLVLTVALVLIALMFLLIEHKANFPLVVGSFLIISALPLLKWNLASPIFGKDIGSFVSLFFSRANFVFWIMAISGGVLILLGIFFKIFSLDFIRQRFLNNDFDKAVQKEVSKTKIQQGQRKKSSKKK
jgi:hypothetical protein